MATIILKQPDKKRVEKPISGAEASEQESGNNQILENNTSVYA